MNAKWILLLMWMPCLATAAEQWAVWEKSFVSSKGYANPFTDVEVDVVFENGGRTWVVPAFWAGDDRWTVRFAPPVRGAYMFRVRCSDLANQSLNGEPQPHEVTAYTGGNPLLRHGKLQVTGGRRHFEFSDGTPFFWLGDTWWKGLCKRISFEGFQELTADRKEKGFTT